MAHGLLPAWLLNHFAGWLSLRLGYKINADAFTAVRDMPDGASLLQAMLPGPQGDRGEAGELGLPGGSVAPRGRKGAPGYWGPAGPPGVITGPPGPDGPKGPKGPLGLKGVKGVKGAQGAAGEPGDPGDPGPSKGPPGPQGIPGMDMAGPPGPDGAPVPGPAGPNGSDGSTGPMGPQGEHGEDGDPGDPGPPGDKFAIVEAHGRCVGLYAMEAPDVLFESVLRFTLPPLKRHHFVNLDAFFVDAVELETLRIAGVVCCLPVPVRAKLDGTAVIIDLTAQPHPAVFAITVQGVRKGFGQQRWPVFTTGQMTRNNHFYAEAWR